jgi:hypothetical protein
LRRFPVHLGLALLALLTLGSSGAPAAQAFQTPGQNCTAGTTSQTVNIEAVVAVGCLRTAGDRTVGLGPIRINGVLFQPDGGRGGNDYSLNCGEDVACASLQNILSNNNALYLDHAAGAFGTTGRFRMSAGTLSGLHRGVINKRNVAWDGESPLLSLGADASVEFLDFPLAGQFSWTPSDDGSSRLALLVGMPVALGGVTGETAVKVNPGGDISFDRLAIDVGEVPVRGFSLGGLHFLYDRTEDVWEGAAELTIPSPSAVTVGVSVRVVNGQFSMFTGSVDNLNIQVAPGIFFQKVGVLFGLNPARVGGSVGMTGGPVVLGFPALRVDASFLLDAQGYVFQGVFYPPSLALRGTVSTFNLPIRSGSVRFYFSRQAWIEAGGTIGLDIKAGNLTLFQLGGAVGGSLRGSNFELAGFVGLTVFDFNVGRAQAILTNKGVGACGSIWNGRFALGGYFRWGQGFVGVNYCDLNRLRSAINSRTVRARSAQGGPTPLPLPESTQQVVRFVGEGGAPRVRLRGPGGRTIDTPGPGVANTSQQNSWLAVRQDDQRQTDVVINNTGKGGWTYEPLPGSAPMVRVQRAGKLPPVDVEAKVRMQRDDTALLTWALKPISGQTVTFAEEGKGAPPRVLKTTSASKGTLRYRPYLMPMRSREVIATVEQYGKPRKRFVVARYTAPALGVMTRVPKLKATRSTKGVTTVTWTGLSAADNYQVIVTEASGRKTMKVATRPRVELRGSIGRTARTVSVRAVSEDAETGPYQSVRVERARSA